MKKYLKLVLFVVLSFFYSSQGALKAQNKIIAGHKAVDLGLSILWADCNIGASSPTSFGDYFGWGEIVPKSIINNTKGVWMGDISGTSYDAATELWGGTWRMPTEDEMYELIKECAWEWRIVDGVKGCKITGPSGNSIFLPAAGHWGTHSAGEVGYDGNYWTSIPQNTDRRGACEDAYFLSLGCGHPSIAWRYRSIFRSIRPVTNK